jgi:hypothetical protein
MIVQYIQFAQDGVFLVWCGMFWNNTKTNIVVTLALGLRPKQRFARVQAKSGARESHFMLLGV